MKYSDPPDFSLTPRPKKKTPKEGKPWHGQLPGYDVPAMEENEHYQRALFFAENNNEFLAEKFLSLAEWKWLHPPGSPGAPDPKRKGWRNPMGVGHGRGNKKRASEVYTPEKLEADRKKKAEERAAEKATKKKK